MDARISFVPILLGILVLLLPQGRDVVRDLANGANVFLRAKGGGPLSTDAFIAYGRWACFLLACVWSGLIAWYWPLLLTRNRWTGQEPGWFTGVRRFLGLAPLLAAWGAISSASINKPRDVWIALTLFTIAIFLLFAFFFYRPRSIAPLFRDSWITKPSWLLQPLLLRFGGREGTGLTRGDDTFVITTFVTSFGALALFLIPAVRTDLAVGVGAAAIAFGAVGAIIAGISVIVWILAGSRLPVLTIGVVLIGLFSFFNDNHTIQAVPSPLVDTRPTIEQAYETWKKQVPDGPLILVASAGGASRAAYWTATVLRALDDRTGGKFSRNVFAISSVSGGSLGTLGYAAWLTSHPTGTPACPYVSKARRDFDEHFAGEDYLSPAVAGLLFPDLFQRFLPVGVLPDRARSIEEGFSRSWARAIRRDLHRCKDVVASSPIFDRDMLKIWQAPLSGRAPWVPIALLNGTLVESGKRIITAPVQINPAVFEDSHDFLGAFKSSITASTAVMNSARFPLVSPAATVPLTDRTGKARGTYHIVDGGYFENGGLETVYDLARYLRTEMGIARPILIIEINNDDEYPDLIDGEDDLYRYPNGITSSQTKSVALPVALYKSTSHQLAPGFKAILGAFYQTRSSRGILAAKRISALRAAGLGENSYFAAFHLTPLLDGQRTAMSWTLSLSSRQTMDEALAKLSLVEPDVYDNTRETQRRLDMHMRCQRAVADQIALAIGSLKNDVEPGCDAKSPVAWTAGFPIDASKLQWSAAREKAASAPPKP